jgi:two-component system sensor histidine kinase ComP
MKMKQIANSTKIIVPAAILFVVIFYLIHITLSFPYIGIKVESSHQKIWQISKVDPISWAKTQGIEAGDIVSLINHKDPDLFPSLIKYHVVEDATALEVTRNGNKIEFTVSQIPSLELTVYHTIIPAALFIILLVFSVFLYAKKHKDSTAMILILFFLAIGTSYLSAGASARTDIVAIIINRLTFLFIPLLFLHFLYRYFETNHIHTFPRKGLLLLYCLAGSLIIVETGFYFLNLGEDYIIVKTIELIFFSTNISLGLFHLFMRYVQYRKTPHKTVLKLLGLGVACSFFPSIVLSALPSILFNIEVVPAPLAALFLLLLPLCFIYLITANKFFDIEFLIDRLRYYSLLSFFLTAFFIIVLKTMFDPNLHTLQWIRLIFVTYSGTVAFLYMKEELDYRIHSKLFSEKYNFQDSLNRFGQAISKIMSVADLEERLLKEVRDVLPVKEMTLFEYDKNHLSVEWRRGDDNYPHEMIINELQAHASVDHSPIVLTHGIFTMIAEKGDKYYILWIGDKANRTALNQEEKKYLKNIASYFSIVYENLYLIEGLSEDVERAVSKSHSAPAWVLRLLFRLSEKERSRLAFDLHDSALQDLLLWHQKLASILTEIEDALPGHERPALLAVQEGMLDVIHQIRETCNELRPPFIKEHGIVNLLENLFTHAQLHTNFKINFDATEFTVVLDYDPLLTIYRIVQELLTNAANHSKATKMDIILANKDGIVTLIYRDNGIGVSLEAFQSSFQHMGLSGIQERIASLEGTTSFRTHPGEGFELFMSFPLVISDKKQNLLFEEERGSESDEHSFG